ncbi:CoA transferase, partial [Streptomyces sp. TRM76130]|nr:CoA transferase [Streptomyces sp. TRM76130]
SATPAAVRTGPARRGADAEAVARDWDVPGLCPEPPHRPHRKADQ